MALVSRMDKRKAKKAGGAADKQGESKAHVSNLASSFVISAIVIAVAAVVYMFILFNVVQGTIRQSLDETAQHDMASITSYAERSWSELQGVGERMGAIGISTIAEAQQRLELEASSMSYSDIYLVDTEGYLYSHALLITRPENNIYLQYFEEAQAQGNNEFLKRLGMEDNVKQVNDSLKEALGMGVVLDTPIQLADVTIDRIVGISRISTIQNSLRHSVYDDQGYSSVVDLNGKFIVNEDRGYSVNSLDTLTVRLEEGTNSSLTVDQLLDNLQSGKSFTFTYTNADGVYMFNLLEPMPQFDWFFVMSIPNSVITMQSISILLLSLALLAVVILVVLFLVVMMNRFRAQSVRAQAEAEARGDFLSNMSHEIRTPLNGLIGLNHLMMQNRGDDAKMTEYLEKSADTSHYLLSLVNDILDMSKMQAGKVDLALEPTNLEDVFDNLYSMQRSNYETRGIHLVFNNTLLEPNLQIDETRFKQVIMNILGNAAKFTDRDGSVTLTTTQRELAPGRIETTVEIADTGCGMSPEFCEKIFDPFSQERNKNSNSVKGTGLGMSISYLLCKAMGGNISVISQEGVGSTFTVVIPADACTEEQVAAMKADHFAASTPAFESEGPQPILVAEDNELNAMILEEILKENGFEPVIAENGKVAVDMFNNSEIGHFRIILMDMQMPVMDGLEATRTIRHLKRADSLTVTIFACTANTFEEDRRNALDAGMDDFLAKPIDVDVLLQKVQRV
ncbi:MAG: ATP-binding protein [Coriobacteriia bacterium]|nr:ATP-binding protein [Coriobacteriia bacterium]